MYCSAALLDRGDTVLEPTQTVVSIPEVINSALGACKLWCTRAVALTSNGEWPMLAASVGCIWLQLKSEFLIYFESAQENHRFCFESALNHSPLCGLTLGVAAVQEGLNYCYSSETILVRNLLNLVTNAVKHTAAGCVQVDAAFKVFAEQPSSMFIEFKVSDTGTGVSAEYHGAKNDRVWLPFESGAQSTGLGLFVVRRCLAHADASSLTSSDAGNVKRLVGDAGGFQITHTAVCFGLLCHLLQVQH